MLSGHAHPQTFNQQEPVSARNSINSLNMSSFPFDSHHAFAEHAELKATISEDPYAAPLVFSPVPRLTSQSDLKRKRWDTGKCGRAPKEEATCIMVNSKTLVLPTVEPEIKRDFKNYISFKVLCQAIWTIEGTGVTRKCGGTHHEVRMTPNGTAIVVRRRTKGTD